MSNFKDKTVLITGGAGGIGFLMGKKALERQAKKFIIWDIDEDRISRAKSELASFSEKVSTYTVDVADSEQIYQTAESVLSNHDSIDILINNAGIVVGDSFANHSREQIDQIIQVNLLGVMHTTRAFLDAMIDQRSGHIVNIASAAGLMANPNMSVYASSKWGVIGWSDSLRLELNDHPNLHVTTIEPSYINTGLFKGVTPPLLTPLLDANEISEKIIHAIARNKTHLRAPFIVKLLPFLKGVLSTRMFDFVAGKLFKVYHSMDTFTGRKNNSS